MRRIDPNKRAQATESCIDREVVGRDGRRSLNADLNADLNASFGISALATTSRPILVMELVSYERQVVGEVDANRYISAYTRLHPPTIQ